jgi:DNA primase
LKINLLASKADAIHVDTLDLYSARQRAVFIKQAAIEMEVKKDVVKHDLGRLLLQLEEMQERQIREALAPKREEPVMTEHDRAGAHGASQRSKASRRHPGRLHALRRGWAKRPTSLMGYIAAVSRHLDAPLAVIVQSSSAARQKLAHGRDPGLCAGRRARRVLGHDGPVAVLHGRDGLPVAGCRAPLS